MKKIKTKLIQFLIVLALGTIVFTACKKDRENPTAIELPPVESMVIDFSDFTGSATKSAMMLDSTIIDSTTENFSFSAVTIVSWNILLGVTLAIPVASYHSALLHIPVYMGDNVWQWSYDYEVFSATYTARLIGTLNSDKSINWKMYITKIGIGGFTEVLWFEGKTNADNNGGTWTLNERQADNTVIPVLQMDWIKEGDKIGSVKYTSIKEGIDFKGSRLTYGVQEGAYDAYYDIYYWDILTQEFYDVDIEWNLETKAGHVMAEKYFGDTNWHCWDSTGYDGNCTK